MRDSVKKVIRAVCFSAGLVMIVACLNGILIKKESEVKYKDFYKEADQYDVLFTGISHVQVGVSPLELWSKHGITSFNLAESGCKIPVSYWLLRNVLEYGDPKLVVMDVSRMELNSFTPDITMHKQFDKVPLSLLKAEAVMDLFDSWEDGIDMLFPFILYHSRWSELCEDDFKVPAGRINKGSTDYGSQVQVYIPEKFEIIPETEKMEGGPLFVDYFEKMIRMCQDRGIEVLLINLPYVAVDRERQMCENGVADIAARYHVNYLNFLHIENVIDYDTDMYNEGHVNPSGMNKITEYLGNYIEENYDIPDRRQDTAYASWEQDYKEFTDYKFRKMQNVDAADKCLVLLADENIDSCIYVKEGSPLFADPRYHKLIQNVMPGKPLTGLSEAAEQEKDYLLIVDRAQNTAVEYVGLSAPEKVKTSFGDVDFGVEDAGGPYLRISGSETGYLAGDADIQMLAVNADTGSVESENKFYVVTKRAD